MKDLTGNVYGELKVLSFSRICGKHYYWNCKCSCGTVKEIRADRFSNKKFPHPSCGCIKNEKGKQRLIELSSTHGESKSRLYYIWSSMLYRSGRLKNYTHIDVCTEWKDFICFRDWAITNGYSKELSIDRIDNLKGYYPSNCRWVDRDTQNNNKRNNIVFEIENENLTLSQIARKYNIKYSTLSMRVNTYGFTIDAAISKIVKTNGNKTKRK